MQHSILDRIYLAFLIILIISFGFLIFFVSYFMRRSLVSEKQETLRNEATLIASQTVGSYVVGTTSEEDLGMLLRYYANMLQADIWYVDNDGNIVAHAESAAASQLEITSETRKIGKTVETSEEDLVAPINIEAASNKDVDGLDDKIPSNIYELDKDYTLDEYFGLEGDFYEFYNDKVITVNVPVSFERYTGEKTEVLNAGTIILHASSAQISDMMTNIYSISFIPCLVIIVIAFLLLSIISYKVIRPIRKLSVVAGEYSKGDFEVKTGIKSKDEIGQLAESMEYMADELNKLEEYRRDFISNISHDFRSPLTSLRGYVTAMIDGTIPTEKHDRYLNIVLNETERLTKLTDGLLELNKLEMYGTYLKQEEFDLIDIIKTTFNTFEIKCIEKNVAIYLNNHAENTMVIADKSKIQQVIYNLLDNALKFTPSGKQIYVTIKDADEKLLVSIRDEGIGMNSDTQKKIWTRFYKEDQSRGMDKGGTGLGLAITREIIKAHNEIIEVESKEGVGSDFTFTLTKVVVDEPNHTGQTEILVNNAFAIGKNENTNNKKF